MWEGEGGGGVGRGHLDMYVEFECYASASRGDVQQILGPNMEKKLDLIKNNETSVKILLAEFPSQLIQESPALLINRKPMSLLTGWPEL